ncbi:MAG: hypothetical protein HQM08_04515 [Candidatus Riflebacteria bacterium]|nr:hypothetical protein [Candidatus Riflebacteria bacterium]
MIQAVTQSPSLIFLLGGLGAGKTELSLNLSLHVAERYGKGRALLVDLDVVNPFFRVRKVREEMENYGVHVVVPDARVINGDLPSLPAEAWGAFQNEKCWVFNDVGGGILGLRLLGRLREEAEKRPGPVLFVVNPFRPGFNEINEMVDNFFELQNFSALKATHIIANPHLSQETELKDFFNGLEKVKNLSERVKIPILFAMVAEQLSEKIVQTGSPSKMDIEIFPIRRFWETPWQFGLKKEE